MEGTFDLGGRAHGECDHGPWAWPKRGRQWRKWSGKRGTLSRFEVSKLSNLARLVPKMQIVESDDRNSCALTINKVDLCPICFYTFTTLLYGWIRAVTALPALVKLSRRNPNWPSTSTSPSSPLPLCFCLFLVGWSGSANIQRWSCSRKGKGKESTDRIGSGN